jgi:glucose 1-dehydrogenase
VFVNNAAVAGAASKPLLETTEDDWDAIMAVNLRGVFLCCKRAIAEMIEQTPIGEVRGRVINISSQHGMVGSPGHVAYSTSKGGVVNLTHQLAVDYGRHGILVNAVAPGKIMTGSPEQANPEVTAYAESRTPFSRLGRPSDVAAATAFLASDDSLFVSGTNLLVDGGWMAY